MILSDSLQQRYKQDMGIRLPQPKQPYKIKNQKLEISPV